MRTSFIASLMVVAALGVSGCGESPQKQIQALLEQGNKAEALKVAQEALQEDNTNAYLNAMAAELLTDRCVRDNCVESAPDTLVRIREHLGRIKGPVQADDESPVIDTYANIAKLSGRLISEHQKPEAFATFVKNALPPNAPRDRFVAMMTDQAFALLNDKNHAAAKSMFATALDVAVPDSPEHLGLTYLNTVITANDVSLTEVATRVSDTLPGAPQLGDTLLRGLIFANLEGALTRDAQNGAANFLSKLPTLISTTQIVGLDTPERRTAFATQLTEAASAQGLVTTIADMLPTVPGQKDKATYVRLIFLKSALALDPSNPEKWAAYFGPALDNTEPGAPLTFLYDGIDLTQIPAASVEANNQRVLKMAEAALASNTTVLPYLKELVYRADAQQATYTEQSADLLRKALSSAVERKSYLEIKDYALYDGEVASPFIDRISLIFADGVQDSWNQDKFDQMRDLADFLVNSLKASFSLDVKVAEMFGAYMASPEVKQALSSDTITDMLKTKDEARIDLGPKYAFVADYLKDRPDIIQAKLQTAAASAEGSYGTPYALLRMYDVIDPARRDDLLLSSLKVALSKDQKTPAVDFAKNASALVDRWTPGLTYNFIINEALQRAKDVDTIRVVWKAGTDDMRQAMEKLRPQVGALMTAIDAFEAGEMRKAAKSLAVITDPILMEAAKPYMSEFKQLILPYAGSYVPAAADSKAQIALIQLIPSEKDLLKPSLMLLNSLGTLETQENFVTDRGKTFRRTVVTELDPGNLSLTIPPEQRVAAQGLSFDKVYGQVVSVALEGGELQVKLQGQDAPVIFRKMTVSDTAVLLPNGRFGITAQASTHDQNSDHVLPIGSILNLETLATPVTRTVDQRAVSVYPVKGTIMHPASREPIELEGYYEPTTHVTEIGYSYPLNDGKAMLDAVVRCQVLENRITCAGHNRHWSRQRYTHIVSGLRSK
jgi:hypothetical protein